MFSFFSPREDENKDVVGTSPAASTSIAPEVSSSTGTKALDTNDAPAPVTASASAPQTPKRVSSLSAPLERKVPTWNDLHRAACLRKHSFLATAAQVQAYNDTDAHNNETSLPLRTRVLLGNDPDLQKKLVQEFQEHEQPFSSTRTAAQAAASTVSTASRMMSPSRVLYAAAATTYAVAATTATVLTSPIRLVHRIALQQVEGDGYDDVPEGYYEQEHQNNKEESAVSIESAIDPKDFVFNVDLALECLRFLQNAASQNPNRILRLESSNEKYSWQGWLQTVATTATAADLQPQSDTAKLLLNLPESQKDLLLRCLVAATSDRVQILRRENAADVVVLGKTNDKEYQQSLQTRLTLHDLEYARCQVQDRIDMTVQKLNASTQRALAARHARNEKLALAEMKRRKLLEQTLESAYAQLQNLEQLHVTLETACHQRDDIKMLREATDALRTIQQQDTNLEQLDDVLDDLQEERDHVTRINDTLASMVPAEDEDELMKELQALTLGDDDKEEVESKDDASTGMPTEDVPVSMSDEKETPTPVESMSASATPIPIGML
jgi:hypothetical protein